MFEQRFVRRCLQTAYAFFLTFASVVLSPLGGGDVAQAQDQEPAPQVQNSTLYFPIVGKGPKISAPVPAPGAANQSPNAYLAWQLGDAFTPDARFTVFLEAGDDTPDVAIVQNLATTSFDPPTLANDTVYYWQVVVFGSNGETQFGPVWNFRTEPWYDPPPIGTMVSVPAGPFWMGCDMNNHGFGDGCNDKDMPLHKVSLSAYAIDKYEVTNIEYRACVQAGACSPPRKQNSHERNHYYKNHRYDLYPVLYVSRDNAVQYCTWAGKRLPTEAEWEKAARGPIDTRPFPWGSEDPDCTTQNRPDENKCDQDLDTTRVGSFPRGTSPYGALDMAGNVFEWVEDQADWGWYRVTPSVNPVNPPTSFYDFTVIRSGSYRDRFSYLRTYHRHSGHYGDFVGQDAPYFRNDRTGFRCAKSLP
jgi:formylglycine-generating enzyme required for sulfatase activity